MSRLMFPEKQVSQPILTPRVTAACAIASAAYPNQFHMRDIATPAEVRAFLGLKGLENVGY